MPEYIKRSIAQGQKEAQQKQVRQVVEKALEEISKDGDAALHRMAQKFDNYQRDDYRLSDSEINASIDSLNEQEVKDIKFAQKQVRNFAEKQKSALLDIEVETLPGVILGHKNIPISSAGCYVPGGRYPMIASAHMSVLTAKVAGVPRIVTCAPPLNGKPVSSIVAAQSFGGADEIYCLGGIQAIGAMALGTESIDPVAIIAGPGNTFVAEAKRQLYGKVGIDLLAGPTETLLIADDTVDGEICAIDLLGQAEHGPGSPAILLTTSRQLGEQTLREVERILADMNAEAVVQQSWKNHGEIILVENREEALEIANELAFEHVQLMSGDDDYFFRNLENYGGLFIGPRTNVAYGDKVIGTNHTLPTRQAARYTGGLWVGKYLKTCTWQRITTDEASVHIGGYCSRLCALEGFMGHKAQADLRVRRYGKEK